MASSTGKTGKAVIVKQGHTTLGRYGDDYKVTSRNNNPTEIRP